MIDTEMKRRLLSSFFLLPFVFYLIIEGAFFFNIFLIIIFTFSVYEFYKFKLNIYLNIIAIIYLLFSFFAIFLLRNINDELGLFYFFIVIIICISTDIGGFVFGKTFKGPKITKISPNKTYAGVIGSYLMSYFFVYIFFEIENKNVYLLFNYFFIIFTISTVSQLGDLLISYFKRKANIKDTGRIIPGHGGILDRIDGMIFAFPVSYFIFS